MVAASYSIWLLLQIKEVVLYLCTSLQIKGKERNNKAN